jgi:carboxyl-terminal processing protease
MRKTFLKNIFLAILILTGLYSLLLFLYINNMNCRWQNAYQGPSIENIVFDSLDVFADAITLVEDNYVEEVEFKDMIYGALGGMMSSLDSYSGFMTPEEHLQLKTETSGVFGGIGIKVTIKDKAITVVSPLEGTPAQKAGIMPGDKIIKIDDKLTKDFDLDESVDALRGDPGTFVKLTILRDSVEGALDIRIKRAIIKVESITQSLLLDDGIGYIRIADFQKNTAADFGRALRALVRKGMRALILDLRNNPGGLLEASVMVSEKFIKKPGIIVSTKGRIEEQNAIFKSRMPRAYTKFPLLVLINKGSASASEIVAGAIKDNKRGIIAGEQSFGKASVQTVIPMADGSALRLTTSYYYTPSGAIIHEKGISPDVIIPFREISSELAVFDETTQIPEDKKRLMMDNQVYEAIMLLKDRQRYESLLT